MDVSLCRWPPSCPTRRGISRGLLLEVVLHHRESDAHVARAPRVGERPRRLLARRRREPAHLVDAERLAARPGHELVDLEVEQQLLVADDLPQRVAGVPPDLDPALAEALRDPRVEVLADGVDEDVPDLGDRLAERRVRLQLLPHQAEHRPGRGRAQVLDDGVDVRRLPAPAQPVPVAAAPVDLGDEHEARVTEQRPGVARRDDVGARDAAARSDEALDRAGIEAAAESLEGDLHLRPIVPADDVGGLQLRCGHAATLDDRFRIHHRSDRSVIARPSDSITIRPSRSVRAVVSPGAASRAAIVSGLGWS